MNNTTPYSLSQAVESALHSYFVSLGGETPTGLYEMVIGEVEKPLFEYVMTLVEGNQSQAAKVLGINRNTLRTRLHKFDMLP